jgi:hypothetical protein
VSGQRPQQPVLETMQSDGASQAKSPGFASHAVMQSSSEPKRFPPDKQSKGAAARHSFVAASK